MSKWGSTFSASSKGSQWGSYSGSDPWVEKDPYSPDALLKQIGNAQTRIQAAGGQANPDDRNRFEKATNLPEKQNWFFDALDLLSRPGEGVKSVLHNQINRAGDSVGNAFWQGFTGNDKVSGQEVAKDLGLIDDNTNKVGKFAAGLGVDVLTDPTNLIPGKVFAAPVQLGAKGLKAGVNALENVDTLAPLIKGAKDTFGHAFIPQYKWDETLNGGTSDSLKNTFNQTNNKIRFDTEESIKNVANIAKTTGLKAGSDVGRIMENDLKINYEPFELLRGISKGQDIRVPLAEGEIKDFVDKANQQILNSDSVKDFVTKRQSQIDDITKRMNDLHSQHDFADLQQKFTDAKRYMPELDDKGILESMVDAGSITQDQLKGLERLSKYEKAREKLTNDINTTKSGIQFSPLESGTGFQLFNPKQRVYKKAIGNIDTFRDAISPKGSLDSVIKSDVLNDVKPITERLIQTGKVSLNSIKGTPVENELKRVFGKDISILNKRNTTITLKNADNYKQPLDQLQFTNRIENVNAPRPQRELSTDATVQEAAQKLMDSNQEIRDLAQSNGIDIKEIEGYMTHILSQEARKAKQQKTVQGGKFGMQPNQSVVKNRKYKGSVEDVKDLYGGGQKEIFHDNAYFSTAIGQKRLVEYIHAEAFKRSVLNDRNFAIPFKNGMTVPDNAVLINPDQYKFMKVSTPEGQEFLGLRKGQEYIVTKGAKEALDRYQALTTDEGTKGFLKLFDAGTSLWKRFALFSIPYHIRNDIGAKFNNWVGGMNTTDIAKYSVEADKTVADAVFRGKESDLFTEYRQQGLGSSNLSQVEFARAGEDPEKAVEKTIKRTSEPLPKQIAKGVVNPLRWFESSRNVGDFIDQTNRFALYKWAREKLNLSPEKAAEKVREVQFDYGQLTNFEKNIAARAIPFYRWMRKNIPFQIQQFINDPRKYNNLNKVRENAQETFGINDQNVPEWMKQQFAFPVTGDGKGSGKFLGLGLPLGDLTKLSSPLNTFSDSLTPLVKLPIELSSNYNMFYNKPIEKFQGQTTEFAGVPLPAKWGYALQQATGQVGRGLSSYLNKPGQEDQDTKFRLPAMGISSILKDYDAEQARKFELLNQLKRLQDQMNYIEQQTGKRPPTLDELRKVGGL